MATTAHPEDPFIAYVIQEWTLGDKDKSGTLERKEVKRLLFKLNLELKKTAVKAKFKSADADKSKKLSFMQFKNFLQDLHRRPELEALFAKYATSTVTHLTLNEFLHFLKEEQKEVDADLTTAKTIIARFVSGIKLATATDAEYKMDSIAFSNYIASASNSVFNPVHTAGIYQDMSQPLPHYFGAASHNTYLMGHQLKGESSCEAYKNALLASCRLLELDCWDGEDGEPIIFHGHTLTSKIKFYDVIETVKKYSFEVSPYPVVLSLENHCSLPQQQRMAQILVEVLGDMLPPSFADTNTRPLPSPDQLKNKVLVKGKLLKRDGASVIEEQSDEEDDILDDDDDDSDDGADKKKKKKGTLKKAAKAPAPAAKKKVHHATAQELSDITHLGSAPFTGYEKSKNENAPWQMSSYSEPKVKKMAKESRKEFIEHNTRFVSKVYPKGTRFDSSNYAPSPGWVTGSQYVALNYQTGDVHMFVNQGKFADNGGCGYLLKPRSLLPSADESVSPTPIELSIKIIGGWQFPKVEGDLKGEIIDPFVRIRVVGAPADEKKFQTKTINNNGFNPTWNETFTFNLTEPALAMVLIEVFDEDSVSKNDFIGYCSFPVSSIKNGYRSALLKSAKHVPLPKNASVLLHLSQQ